MSGSNCVNSAFRMRIPDKHSPIVSSDEDPKDIRVVFRLSSAGYVRSLASLKPGDTVSVIGPLGSSFTIQRPHERIVFIAGGVHVAPIMSILRSESSKKKISHVELFTYNTSIQETPYHTNIAQLEKNMDALSVHEFFRRPKGQDFTPVANATGIAWFVTGSSPFVNAVSGLLRDIGIQDATIHFNESYPTSREKNPLHKLTHTTINTNRPFQLVAEQASNHIVITDENGKIVFANKAAERLTGYTFAEMRGQTPRLWGGLMPKDFYEKLWKTIKHGDVFAGNIINRRKDGKTYTALARITPLTDASRRVIGFLATEEDISEKAAEEQAESEFVSFASHQLRSPLTNVSWITESLLSTNAKNLTKKQQGLLTEISLSNKHMIALIEDLLNISRLELGTLAIRPCTVRLDGLADSVIKEQRPGIQIKGLKLTRAYAKNVPAITADPNLLRIVFQNLLSNAVKYSSEHGKVEFGISLDKTKKHVTIRVSNTGIGIPKAEKDKIFTKFFRAGNTQKEEGTGLGLYIVRSIIERAGGKIRFESEEDEGATFFVTLPIRGMKIKK